MTRCAFLAGSRSIGWDRLQFLPTYTQPQLMNNVLRDALKSRPSKYWSEFPAQTVRLVYRAKAHWEQRESDRGKESREVVRWRLLKHTEKRIVCKAIPIPFPYLYYPGLVLSRYFDVLYRRSILYIFAFICANMFAYMSNCVNRGFF